MPCRPGIRFCYVGTMPVVYIHRRTCQGNHTLWALLGGPSVTVPHAGNSKSGFQRHRAARRGPRVSTHRCHKLGAMRMLPTHAIALARAGPLAPVSRRATCLWSRLPVSYSSCVRRTGRTYRCPCSACHPLLYSQPGFHPAKDCCDRKLPQQKTCETPAQRGFSRGFHFQRGRRWFRERCSGPG